MSRPKNKDEYRQEMAEAFARVLEEKGLQWRKEWKGIGGCAPHNAITKACYRGSNAFWLSLVAMMKGYNDPRWVTMTQIMDRNSKYHPNQKQVPSESEMAPEGGLQGHLCGILVPV